MILTCPACSTRYQANDEAFLPAGRRVRCARCSHVWYQDPPVAEAEAEVEAVPQAPAKPEAKPASPSAYAPSSERGLETAPARKGLGERLALLAGWLGLVAVVLVIGWAAVGYRQQVATLWPQSASLYAALGLPVNASGIAFSDVSYRREHEDKQLVLAVSGKLVNISGRELAVPPIRVILTGADGRELYRWDFTADVTVLHAGQSAPFLTRLSSPPGGARHLTVQFADAKG